MRIAVNARTLIPHRMEGVARFAWETTKRMILSHPEDQFYLFFDRPFDDQFIIAPNVTGIILRPQARHPILWNIWFDYSVIRAIKKYSIEVFYSPDGFSYKKKLDEKIGSLIVTHDLAYLYYPDTIMKSHLPYYQKNVPIFHEISDHIITVSESTKQDIIANFGIEASKITVAYNALMKVSHFEKTPRIEGKYFLYLGSIHPRKNIKRLLASYELFRKNQVHSEDSIKLVIAGRRAFKKENLEEYLDRMEYKNEVIFTGAVDEETKWNLLHFAHIFVYISLFEGFGIPLLEAMEMGIPVISSKEGALSEIGGNAIFQVDPLEIESIVEGMEKLWDNKTLRQNLITNGKHRVQDFSWDESAHKIYAEIKNIALSKVNTK